MFPSYLYYPQCKGPHQQCWRVYPDSISVSILFDSEDVYSDAVTEERPVLPVRGFPVVSIMFAKYSYPCGGSQNFLKTVPSPRGLPAEQIVSAVM